MNKNILILSVVVLLFVVSIVQTIQITNLKNQVTGNVANAGSYQQSGDSYSEMIAQMHPDQVQSSGGNSPTMVGGC